MPGTDLPGEPDRFRCDLPRDPPLESRETLELIRAYYRINDAQVRKRLFELAKALGSAEVWQSHPRNDCP